MKQCVLITGSSGMLGVDLSQELHDSYEVIEVDLAGSRESGVGSRFKKADITDKKNIETVVKNIQPDIIIHAAAYTDVDGCEIDPKEAYKINSIGTGNVALACKVVGATLIYISTDFVFDGKKKKPYKETDKTNPLSVYADSKLKGEEAVKKSLKKYYILRTSWLYGKHGKNFVDTIITKAKNENILRVVDDQVGSPTYAKDLAKAIHALLDKVFVQRTAYSVQRQNTQYAARSTQYGIYHISNSGSVSWFDYAREILSLAKFNTKIVPISSKELNRPAKRPAMSVLDNSKFNKLTGFIMRNWREALKRSCLIP